MTLTRKNNPIEEPFLSTVAGRFCHIKPSKRHTGSDPFVPLIAKESRVRPQVFIFRERTTRVGIRAEKVVRFVLTGREVWLWLLQQCYMLVAAFASDFGPGLRLSNGAGSWWPCMGMA